MSQTTDSSTSPSLIERLRDEATREAAWREFCDRYGRLLYRWCAQWGLQASDAADVAQETLLVLVQQIDRFDYDPQRSFRGWIKVVARRTWYLALRTGAGRPARGDAEQWRALRSLAARDDLGRRAEALAERELFEAAAARVQCQVEPTTWQAFQLSAIEEVPLAEVGQRLGLELSNVYRARYRVQRLLRQTLAELDPPS